MEIVTAPIEEYLNHVTPQEDPILAEMEARAGETDFPIVGPLVGRLLYQLVKLSGSQRILELGSGFGYSAYWFGKALEDSGEIILTEFQEENLALAKDWFQRGKIPSRATFHQGDALDILEGLEGEFDIIFNDVDKHRYPEVLPKAAARLRRGGLLISDNVLWHGRVVESDPDETTRKVLEYNRLIFEDSNFFSSIIPIRHRRYGIPGFSPEISRYTLPSGREIIELPLSTFPIGRMRLPVAGGAIFGSCRPDSPGVLLRR